MHHPSWLFSGGCSNPHRQDSAFHDISAKANNSNSGSTGFEINSFVRSLNRNGIQLPENLILKSTGLSDDNKNSKSDKRDDDKVRKSINDFLSVLNESVDHVVGTRSRDRSNTSSFESFRSTNEDRDAAAWNDLIQLVSSTAHEFRNVKTTGNATTASPYDRSGSSGHRTLASNSSRWFPYNQQVERVPQPKLKSSRVYGTDCEGLQTCRVAEVRKIDLDVTPTNEDSQKPEVVGIYSEIRGLNGERVFEKHFVNEILGAAGNSRDRNPSAWVTCNRRINLEDNLWPAGFTMTSNTDFPPYFTGGPNKVFNFRSKIDLNSKRFMNVSRSSPIFVDAGEAIAEPSLDSLAQEHLMDDRCKAHPKDEHPIDCRPTKLDKTLANLENVDSQGSRYKPSSDSGQVEAKPSPRAPEEKKKSLESSKNEGDGKRIRGRAKLVVKRGRKMRMQFTKRNGRKNVSETEEEDPSDQETKSIDQSPRTPMQRFFVESCQARRDDESIGKPENENNVESQMRIVSKIRSPTSNQLVRKQLRPVAKPYANDRYNRVVAADRNKKDFSKVIEKPSLTSTRNSVGQKWLNVKCICDKSNRNPGRNVKVTSSPSIPGNLGQSRIPQSTTPQLSKQNITAVCSGAKNSVVPTVSSVKLQNQSKCATFEVRKLQRPSTAKEISRNRVQELEPQVRTLKSLNSRGTSRDCNKLFKNNGTSAAGGKHETTNPMSRSKTSVHQIKRESSTRCIAVEGDHSMVMAERASSKFTLSSSTSGPMKQLYRKPWKNVSRVQKDADLSSETNLDDTPIDSRLNTDTELSRSVSAVSNSNLKNVTRSVEFKSEDSLIREKGLIKDLDAKNKSTTAKHIFQNKHARSLRLLKSILSHQGVNVEGVNKDAKEIRSRISKEPEKKSQVPICTGRKRSAPIPETDKDSPKTSRTLFEKLAILAEPQPEKLSRTIPTKGSPGRCSSFMNLGSGSMMSCAKSTKDVGDQCSINYASTMVSETSVNFNQSNNNSKDPQVEGSSIVGPVIYVDASVSPLPSLTDMSRLESTKSFDVAGTQTHCNVVDKDSITEKRCNPVIDVCTGTEIVTQEISVDCCKESKDIACGKDFLYVTSISREVNTETPDVFVKSRGVCFRGARKVNESSQVTPFANFRDTASGRDYVQPQGISELVNTDRQDYLYVDRSVEVLGPKTAEDGCQIEPQVTIVDVAVGDCYRGHEIPSRFSTIKIVEDFNVSSPTSFTNLDLPNHNYASSGSSRSSLVPWRGTSAEQSSNSITHVPREAIVALGMVLKRSKNLYKAMEIHRENLATRKMKLGHEPKDINVCEMEGKIDDQLESNEKQFQSLLSAGPDLNDEVATIMNELLNTVTGDVTNYGSANRNSAIEEPSLVEKNQEGPHPKIIELVEEMNENDAENPLPKQKSRQLSLLSRNSLLTVVYGTVCSFVFWALQFSITCDSV